MFVCLFVCLFVFVVFGMIKFLKALKYRNGFSAVVYSKLSSCAPVINFVPPQNDVVREITVKLGAYAPLLSDRIYRFR